MSDTKRESYQKIQAEGKVGFRQRQILNALKYNDLTRAELAKVCGIKLSSVCGRVKEEGRADTLQREEVGC